MSDAQNPFCQNEWIDLTDSSGKSKSGPNHILHIMQMYMYTLVQAWDTSMADAPNIS